MSEDLKESKHLIKAKKMATQRDLKVSQKCLFALGLLNTSKF